MKVLLNAESFGFGPSAAIAAMFNHIKSIEGVEQIDYIGNGHSLDLHKKLPYNYIYNQTSQEDFKNIVKNYDLFFTALDFNRATWAIDEGIKTVIYDSLLWYWSDISPAIEKCDYYIAQDFYGVKERLTQLKHKNYCTVAPLIEKSVLNNSCSEIVLINFGGLENPYWDQEVTIGYIEMILQYILPLLKGKNIQIACSKKHENSLVKYGAKNYSYKEMQVMLQKCELLIATPGLGNIYESANYQLNSIFLPPANDSQGQQLKILIEKKLVNNYIDWLDFDLPVNYYLPQKEVLGNIKINIEFLQSKKIKGNLQEKIRNMLKDNHGNKDLTVLLEKFGSNGNEKIKKQLEKVFYQLNLIKVIK